MQTLLDQTTLPLDKVALESNTTGQINTAVGENSLENKYNWFKINNRLLEKCFNCSNTTGTNNTAVGYQDALDANTTGDQNTAVGKNALEVILLEQQYCCRVLCFEDQTQQDS